MTDKEFVLEAMQAQGLAQAKTLQAEAPELTGTELYAREGYLPDSLVKKKKGRCSIGRKVYH